MQRDIGLTMSVWRQAAGIPALCSIRGSVMLIYPKTRLSVAVIENLLIWLVCLALRNGVLVLGRPNSVYQPDSGLFRMESKDSRKNRPDHDV